MSEGKYCVIANVIGVVIVVVVHVGVVANVRKVFSSSRSVTDGDVKQVVENLVVKQKHFFFIVE